MKSWLCIGLMALINPLYASQTIGRVYEIPEVDPVAYIQRKAARIDWSELYSNRSETWKSQLRNASLARTKINNTRQHKPYHELEKEIVDKDGQVIYPQGYRFNPMEFLTLPYRIFVVDDVDIAWLKPRLSLGDKVLLNSGDLADVSHALETNVYILDKLTNQKLNAEVVPSIITQVGDALEIQEVVNVP